MGEAGRDPGCHREGGEDPISGEALGLPKFVIDVSVEVLHGPHGALLQQRVQGALLLHELIGQMTTEVTGMRVIQAEGEAGIAMAKKDHVRHGTGNEHVGAHIKLLPI